MEKVKLIDRIKYQIDKKLSKSTGNLVIMLSSVIIVFLLLVSFLIIALQINEDFLNVVWDLLSTTINAWMPEYDDNVVYMLVQAVMAVIGLLFTSFLIGVITTAIEERLTNLRKGKSRIIESDHTIIIGFETGSYEVLNQLISATGDEKRVIVVCDEMEKDEMEDDIYENVEVPKNIEIICRNIDITNPSELSYVVPEDAKTVIINIMEDKRTVKATLAVLTYLRNYPECKTKVVSSVSAGKYLLPVDSMKEKNTLMIKTNNFITKLIAHTIGEPGLSSAYKEFLGFEGNELYFEKADSFVGLNITELSSIINKAIVLGVKGKDGIILNPDKDYIVEMDDELILLEEGKGSYKKEAVLLKDLEARELKELDVKEAGKLVVFGYNYKMRTLLEELPENFNEVLLVNSNEETKESIEELIEENPDLNLHYEIGDLTDYEYIKETVKDASHILIISNDDTDEEEDDVANILLMLKLIDIRKKNHIGYNMTIELQLESSRNLIVNHKYTDFIIAFNIVSMLLVQLAERPHLYDVFSELLSNEGNEIYVRPFEQFNLKEKDYSFRTLKQILLTYGCVLLGYDNEEELKLNPDNDERIDLKKGYKLVVLGKNL